MRQVGRFASLVALQNNRFCSVARADQHAPTSCGGRVLCGRVLNNRRSDMLSILSSARGGTCGRTNRGRTSRWLLERGCLHASRGEKPRHRQERPPPKRPKDLVRHASPSVI